MYTCTVCFKDFEISEGCYIGPKDRGDQSCSPYAEYDYVCSKCNEGRE